MFAGGGRLAQRVEHLPQDFDDLRISRIKETLALRGITGLSYREIAEITGVPLGTVMSRLASCARQAERAGRSEQPLQHLRRLFEAPHGQSRQTRVHPGAAADRGLSRDARRRGRALDAIRLGAISFDAVKQLVIAKVEHRPANLDLGLDPYLPAANVKTTSAAYHMVLVSAMAA